MSRRTLFPLFIISLSSQFTIATAQTTHLTQTVSASTAQRPKWTEGDRETLLAKAQRGDRGAKP